MVLFENFVVSFAGFHTSTLHPPHEAASADQKKNFLERQLDSLRGRVVLGNLMFLEGPGTRARGGALLRHACINTLVATSTSFLMHANHIDFLNLLEHVL